MNSEASGIELGFRTLHAARAARSRSTTPSRPRTRAPARAPCPVTSDGPSASKIAWQAWWPNDGAVSAFSQQYPRIAGNHPVGGPLDDGAGFHPGAWYYQPLDDTDHLGMVALPPLNQIGRQKRFYRSLFERLASLDIPRRGGSPAVCGRIGAPTQQYRRKCLLRPAPADHTVIVSPTMSRTARNIRTNSHARSLKSSETGLEARHCLPVPPPRPGRAAHHIPETGHPVDRRTGPRRRVHRPGLSSPPAGPA